MSGGVDSSVSALLLKEAGYDLFAVFMKNWEESDENGKCNASKDFEDVVKTCEILKIPYYSVNFVQEYQDEVFAHFLKEYEAGYTPNPDILCNREIKFKHLFAKVKHLGADFLATGHYCQTDNNNNLLKGKDPQKDQSYFLYTLKKEILRNVLFPIGHMLKKEVKQIAKEHNFPAAEKKESMGICFIGKRDFKPFLGNYLGFKEGNIENLDGKVIGKHSGCAYYTIGQRKDLRIGGKGEAWFVAKKDIARNVIVAVQGSQNPALFEKNLIATDLSFIAAEPPKLPLRCSAKIRYRQKDQVCTLIEIKDGKAFVEFDLPQRAVTPRQSIVFYDQDVCLGGGMIAKLS